jgi:hypothetical protein
MKRTFHLVVGAVLSLLSALLCVIGIIVYISTAASPESSAGSISAVFGTLFLACAFGALWNFMCAFQPPQRRPNSSISSLGSSRLGDQAHKPDHNKELINMDRANERLALLLAKSDIRGKKSDVKAEGERS